MATNSRFVWLLLLLCFGAANAALVTTDPLTKLPVSPATVGALGNDPQTLPASVICKSKMQANMYTVINSKMSVTNAWYASHLSGMKHVHGYGNQRTSDAYFSPDGKMVALLVGSPAAEGADADTYAVSYYTFQPGISEKLVQGMITGKLQC